MLQSLQVSVDVQNRVLGKILSEEFLNQPDISISRKPATPGNGAEPNIFFIDDDTSGGDVLGRIRALRGDFPKSSIFVVSSDASPDHIVEVMKAGASEYFLNPINPQKVREAIERVQLLVLQRGKGTTGAAYAFVSSKGGLGTTVLAVNTAAALAARKSGRVSLIDLSLQAGDSSVLLDIVAKTTIADIARNFDRLDASLIAGVMEKHPAGIDLLAAPVSPEDAAEITAEQVQRTLHLGRGMYDAVIVDCPSMTVDGRTLEAFRGADKVFVVTDLSVPAVRNASRLLKLFQKAGFAAKKIEVVANRFSKGQAGTIDEVEKTLSRRLFWLFPNDFESAMASINRGTPLLKYDPRSPLARSIVEFAQKIMDPAAFPNYRGVKGLLGKTF